jgi:type I restriction enzyme S subunit
MDRFGNKVICNPPVKLEKGNFYPLVSIDKITPGYKTVESDEILEYIGQGGSKFDNNDVVMARITPCLENGKIAIAKTNGQKAMGSTELFVFRGKKGVSDSEYIYYLLCMPYMRQMAANSMTGASGRQRADLGFIKKIPWNFPSIGEQKKIVATLSVFDDLIETNNKRIKVLEQMAENLYKEWFVRFRFPGHEKVKFEHGNPQGWNYCRLDQQVTFNPTLPIKKGTAVKSIPMEALSTNSMIIDESCFDVVESTSGSHSQNGDVLVARITPCLENGKTGFVMGLDDNETATGSTEFIVLRSKTLSPYLVYFIARSQYFRETAILSMNGADGRQRVDVKKLKSLKCWEPPRAIVDRFTTFVKPYFDEIFILHQKNLNLAKQRNLLLPRLMSGKLEVH